MKNTFDMTTIGPNAKMIADEAATAIRDRFNRDAREIGEKLLGVKEVLPHGAFLPWLTAELQITPRTAQNYMHLAAFLRGKSENVSHLPLALIYRLSAPDTPSDIIANIVSVSERGERLDAKTIRNELADRRSKKNMTRW